MISERARLARNKRQRKYAARHREALRLYSENYRRANVQKVALANKSWRTRNVKHYRQQRRAYYSSNRNKILAACVTYVRRNKSAVAARRHKRYLDNVEMIRTKNGRYYRANKAKIRITQRESERCKRAVNANYRIKGTLRARILAALKLSGARKSARTCDLLGCDIPFLRQHLESQFKDGMNWENHGITGWHIDHITPCAKFDLADPSQKRACFHWSNLQPLWYSDNIRKGDSITLLAGIGLG